MHVLVSPPHQDVQELFPYLYTESFLIIIYIISHLPSGVHWDPPSYELRTTDSLRVKGFVSRLTTCWWLGIGPGGSICPTEPGHSVRQASPLQELLVKHYQYRTPGVATLGHSGPASSTRALGCFNYSAFHKWCFSEYPPSALRGRERERSYPYRSVWPWSSCIRGLIRNTRSQAPPQNYGSRQGLHGGARAPKPLRNFPPQSSLCHRCGQEQREASPTASPIAQVGSIC